MKKLRRSRAMKFFAGLMCIFFAAAIVFNIAGTIILMEENLYYASREQMQQKVYSYIYNYTANDLMNYLGTVENLYHNNDNYRNYHNSEIELYRSKYSKEQSSIYFEIRDDRGNLLLKNDTPVSEPFFTFSSVYSTGSISSADNTISEYKTSYETEGYTSITDNHGETYYADDETVLTEQSEYEATTASESESSSVSLATENKQGYSLKEIRVENIYSGNDSLMLYFYEGELNSEIFNQCKKELEYLEYDISGISFFQDEYSYNPDTDTVSRIYSPSDDSAEEKSIETTLTSNGKTARITYKYNGSFYTDEFSDRLCIATLILQNSNSDHISETYRQKNRIQLEMKINIPYSSSVNDVYGITEDLVKLAVVYRDNLIFITVADLILLLAAFVFLFYSAGYIPKHDAPVARGLHAIPYDLVVFCLILFLIFDVFLFMDNEATLMFIACTSAVFILLGFSYTTLVRARAEKIKTGCLTYKLYKSLKSVSEMMEDSKSNRLKIAFIAILFLTVTAFELLAFLIFDLSAPMVVLILLILRLTELPVIILICISLLALHNGAKNISGGNVAFRIKNPLLKGPLRKHAEYLNNINDAVNSAVEERMKSESLKTELITNVSHDLKTPLTSIVNYVDLLKKEKIDSPSAVEYISIIDRQSQRLKKLTIDIVEASKAATGNIEMHPEALNLNVILQQTNGEYIERLSEKNLSLIQEIPESDIIVTADGTLLWRIIDNLMNNIYKYSMPGTRVYLSLYEINNIAYISFRNISKAPLSIPADNLTERFVRGDTSRNTEGSGLGLSIANSLTEIMGGQLSVVTDGDLFKVTLSFRTDK